MILLNNHGKQVGTVGTLRNVWSLGSFNPAEEYAIQVASLEDSQGGTLQLPVKSVGKIGLRYYFAADLRFISFPGAECVYPQPPLQLSFVVFPVAGGYKGSLTFEGESVFTTPQFMPSEKDVVSGLARWAEKADKRFVMPEAIVEAMNKGKKVAV